MGFFDRFPSTKLNDINLDWILKIISKFKGGNAGQFLRKRSNADFDFYWSDSGGGGVSDYDELENRPQINSVTLAGNQSASDLGLLGTAALEPYRTAAAQDSIDASKQAKITASGMLKGDGDGGVTAATAGTDYLAPAALMPYRTAAAQDSIDASKQAKITASGMLKGDGDGGVTAATAGTDYLAPAALMPYRTAAAQNLIDGAQNTQITARAKASEIGIVITGALPSMVVSAGQYVVVRNSTITGIVDGLYKAVKALSPGTNVTAADLSAVSVGGLNSAAPVFSVETTYLTSKEVAAGSQVSWNESIARAGKTPIAIVGLSTNRQSIYILGFSLSASTEKAYLAGKNTLNSAVTASGAYIQVLYINK